MRRQRSGVADQGDAAIEGWMLKEGRLTGWQRRWFGLYGSKLVYWSSTDTSSKPKGAIDLETTQEVLDVDGVLVVHPNTGSGGRVVRLNPVGDEPTRAEWLEALQDTLLGAQKERAESRAGIEHSWSSISGNSGDSAAALQSLAAQLVGIDAAAAPALGSMSEWTAALKLQGGSRIRLAATAARRREEARQAACSAAAATAIAAVHRGRAGRAAAAVHRGRVGAAQAAARGFLSRRRQMRAAQRRARWGALIAPGEEVVLAGAVQKKRRMLGAQTRHLALTDRPRLFYARAAAGSDVAAAAAAVPASDGSGLELRGEVLGSSIVGCELEGDRGFCVVTPGQTFHFTVNEALADVNTAVPVAEGGESGGVAGAAAGGDGGGGGGGGGGSRRASVQRVPGALAWVAALQHIVAANNAKLSHEGWLSKRAISGSKALPPKRRHFTLAVGGTLAYAKTKGGTALGTVRLTHDSIVRVASGGGSGSKGADCRFEIVTPDMGAHRSLLVVAADVHDRERWMAALQKEVAALRKQAKNSSAAGGGR
jgi:hypothetical protein